MSPVSMTTSGDRPSEQQREVGVPSTPKAMAVVALNTATGSIYQNSRLTTAVMRRPTGLDRCVVSRSQPLLPSRVVGQPVQGYSGGPRLVGGAKELSGKRVEVLTEPPDGELVQSHLPQPLCSFMLAGADQRPPQEPTKDGPRRPSPVAAGMEPRVLGAGGGRQRPTQPPVSQERR